MISISKDHKGADLVQALITQFGHDVDNSGDELDVVLERWMVSTAYLLATMVGLAVSRDLHMEDAFSKEGKIRAADLVLGDVAHLFAQRKQQFVQEWTEGKEDV